MDRSKNPSSGDMPQRAVSRSESSASHLIGNHNQRDLSPRETKDAKAITKLRDLAKKLEEVPPNPNYEVYLASLQEHLRALLPPDSAFLSLVNNRPLHIKSLSVREQEYEKRVLQDLILEVIDYIESHGIYAKPKDQATLQDFIRPSLSTIIEILTCCLSILATPTASRPPEPRTNQHITASVHREDSTRNIKKLNYPPDNTIIRKNNTTKDRN